MNPQTTDRSNALPEVATDVTLPETTLPETTLNDGPPPPPPLPDAEALSAPLEHVVDDLAPKESAADWVYDEMRQGRTLEDLTDELLAQGWSRDDADEIVEFVRKETRKERGVQTREDVARSTYASYAASIGRLPYLLFGGIFVVASNLLRSLRGMRKDGRARVQPLPSQRESSRHGGAAGADTSLGGERVDDGQDGE